jgi:hypothetical protein
MGEDDNMKNIIIYILGTIIIFLKSLLFFIYIPILLIEILLTVIDEEKEEK